MNSADVAVIGAGPAGIFAAIAAGSSGRKVVLLDKNEQLGRKLLATGNGRCNLTNSALSLSNYHGEDLSFVESVISRFDQHSTMRWFEKHGLMLREEQGGRVFARSNQAASVLRVLQQQLRANSVLVSLGKGVSSLSGGKSWRIVLEDESELEADSVILATGGRAGHQYGSTGDGWHWARKLGHRITPYYAALVAIETVEHWVSDMQGVKLEAAVISEIAGRRLHTSTGDLLFTNYGISGPAAMAHAGVIAPYLAGGDVVIRIDLFPDLDKPALVDWMQEVGIGRTVFELLNGAVAEPVIGVVCDLVSVDPDIAMHEDMPGIAEKLATVLKDMRLSPKSLRQYKEAQVTAGGIDCTQVNSETLESTVAPGLQFAGEILDVWGDSGGYNLQWAWSSGFVAGTIA